MKQSWLFACVILLGSAWPVHSATDESQYVQSPDRDKKLTEIQGQIKVIDIAARQLTVQDHSGQTVTVHAAPTARVLDSENHQLEWTSLKVGDTVDLYYDTAHLTTLQIDLKPSVGDVLMGNPDLNHPQQQP